VELKALGEVVSAERQREENLPARNGRRDGSEAGKWWIL